MGARVVAKAARKKRGGDMRRGRRSGDVIES
jgi:hypothetical protein